MRNLALIAAATLAIGGAAFAQDAAAPAAAPAAGPAADSTLGLIVSRGMTMLTDMGDFEIAFRPDGSFDAGVFAGKYRVEGKKLCLEITDFGVNVCSEYPDGKKSGDTFPIQTDQGPVNVRIK